MKAKKIWGVLMASLLTLTTTAQEVDTLAANHPEYLPSLEMGTQAPEIVARDTAGVEVRLSSFRGKYVILDFWATWCGDCRREIPMLKELYENQALHSIDQKDDVRWLSFSFDDKEENWRNFLRKEQFPWPQVSNLKRTREDPTYKAYLLHWIPAFFIIDPTGKIVGKAITAKGLENELIRISTHGTLKPAGTYIKASDPDIQYLGRVSFKHPDSPMFTFPSVQIRATFTGTSLKMMAKPNSGYFMARIDGSEAFKVAFNSERDSIVTLAAALPQGTHQVSLMYVTEGYDRRAEFRGFLLDKGQRLLPPPALSQRRIEFIGNSITCGYGVESTERDAPFLDETCNHYYTYAARTARNLQAEEMAVCRSGIGVYRNYNGPRTGDKINMNTEYTHTLLYDNSEQWDFTRYQPQVVCINLGTNDTSTSGADPKLLRKGYEDLLQQVRKAYAHAKIVFLCGPMMNGDALILAKKTMDEVVAEANKKGDKEVYRFDFKPQNGNLGYGASWHPSYWQHEQMAGELTPYLRKLMNWN